MYHLCATDARYGFLVSHYENGSELSGKQIYKDMTKFWGRLFASTSVATRFDREFQFD